MSIGAEIQRLKREDCNRIKHDSRFSKWKVLIGPSDWEDYLSGKEGAIRYRIHNLPTVSNPGLYELGIAVLRSGFGRDINKLDSDDILVVYLGQAENVRARLQRYGFSGAHLCNSFHRNDPQNAAKEKGLFEEIFDRGYPIVFRWASMENKRLAEQTEAQLLNTFDYAWNRGCNGVRRPRDVLEKLEKLASSSTGFAKISRKLLYFQQKEKGIKIRETRPISLEKSSDPDGEDGRNMLARIFKFGRSQPTPVSRYGIDNDFTNICGFIMSDGLPCEQPPVLGRKRCQDHKGRRVYIPSPPKSSPELKSPHGSWTLNHQDQKVTSVANPCDETVNANQDQMIVCGVNFADGTFCQRPAVAGRKRCEDHKGMRVNSFISKPKSEDNVITDDKQQTQLPSKNYTDQVSSSVCGAELVNGSYCRRQTVQGNIRCWQHKGKVGDSTSLPRTGILGSECGVILFDGSTCKNPPVHGRKRCEEHKGMRVKRY